MPSPSTARTSEPPRVEITPDPRISNLRPGWLADDERWRDQLQSLSYDDAMFFERQWELAGGAPPTVDTSWVKMTTIDGGSVWPLVIIIATFVVAWVVGLVVYAAG
jgi:hypothetical protein